jgi:3-dehydroquinate synthase
MQKKSYQFSSGTVTCYFDADFSYVDKLTDRQQSIFVTDEHISSRYKKWFANRKTVILPPGESFKTQQTVDRVIEQFIEFGADRKTMIVGIGGGVVTDITGYAASVYMRGLSFGFIPSSILSMVDASIGGKNGIDVGPYKNLVGTIRQPRFLLYDTALLRTLPAEEWVNGFAEVIKHAAIKDAALFRELEKNSIRAYKKDKKALADLIRRNVQIKSTVVRKDEFEKNERKLLNFGHTLGHAVENIYRLPHGQAVATGMRAACLISEELVGFKETTRVEALLDRYGLVSGLAMDPVKILEVMRLDKKKVQDSISYIVLDKIGKGSIRKLPVAQLEKLIYSITRAR